MKRRTLALALCLVLVISALVGCERDPEGNAAPPEDLSEYETPPEDVTTEPLSLEPPMPDNPVEKQPLTDNQQQWLTANINSFSADSSALLLRGAEGNVIYSPTGAYLALSLLYECAQGETRAEIGSLLQPEEAGDQSKMSHALLGNLIVSNQYGTLQAANVLFTAPGLTTPGDLQQLLLDSYDAAVLEDADFKNPAEINAWVDRNTNGMISAMEDLHPDTVALILNTILLEMDWQDQFLMDNTAQDTFYLATGEPLLWDFMNRSQIGGLNYVQTDRFTSTYLSLQGGYRVYFLLPAGEFSPDDLLADPDVFATAINMNEGNPYYLYADADITYRLPKLDFSVTLPLIDTLEDLGVHTAFSAASADFLLQAAAGAPVYVSDAKQQTKLQMNENGVKAAAVTSFSMNTGGGPEGEIIDFDFILDRPFLFAITAPEGYILFTGVINDPSFTGEA